MATLVLWVEDRTTRDYLRAVWGNPTRIQIRIGGGGNEGILALVKTFEESDYLNVFGLIDGDFKQSNIENWRDPNKNFRTFVLPVHEIENYMLDPSALHASRYHNRKLDISQIDEKLAETANKLRWWVACRETIAELRRRFREPFLKDPSQAITDEISAHDHICRSEWFEKLAVEIARSTEAEIHSFLSNAYVNAEQAMRDDSWRSKFAGKEIFHHVASWMCDRTKISTFPKSKSDFHADLAKQIGAWQLRNNLTHPSIPELLTSLNDRISRP